MYNPQTESFRNFIVQDGLSGNEFNQNALVRLHDGRLVIGSSKGIDIFRPEKIQINQNLPRVVFTGFEVLNREIAPGQNIHGRVILEQTITYTKKIVLTHREKVFSIEFAALNYTLPEKCSYLYKLEGFDTEWSEASSNHRRVSYSNLDAGEYIFKVKASNNDGKWGNNDISISISVLPPFYKTWWFKTLLFILLGLVVFFIYQYLLNIHRNRFLSLQAGQQKKIMELEKEKLESELQKMTFHIINRNRVLIDQKNRLLGLSFKARESVKIGLQDIIGIIDEDLNDEKDWTYIEPQLDKVYNNFVSRLKERHPDLTISEIKIAAYVRMNLSTKEISEFMHKTSRAVENDRYRLRKKIGLESNDSLQHYLMNL
jgi:DNA-binding CsgD family transcriptional regulator